MTDIKTDVVIDGYNLDDECENHPNLFYHYSSLASDAYKEKDEAKQTLDRVIAEVSLGYYSGQITLPVGIAKLTGAIATSLVDASNSVIDAKQALTVATAVYNKAKSAEESMQHRKYMLGHLKDLHLNGYNSKAKGSRAAKSKEDSTADRMRKNMNKDRKDTDDE